LLLEYYTLIKYAAVVCFVQSCGSNEAVFKSPRYIHQEGYGTGYNLTSFSKIYINLYMF